MGITELFHKVGIRVKNNTEKFLAHTVAKQMIALKRLDSKQCYKKPTETKFFRKGKKKAIEINFKK